MVAIRYEDDVKYSSKDNIVRKQIVLRAFLPPFPCFFVGRKEGEGGETTRNEGRGIRKI
jgi:hypothetical protein